MRGDLILLGGGVIVLARYLTGVVSKAPFAVLDRPGDRSLHTTPVSRIGGIALIVSAIVGVAAGALTGMTTFGGAIAWSVTGAAGVVFAASAAEDVFGLSPAVRFAVQSVGAGTVVTAIAVTGYQAIAGIPDWLTPVVAVGAILWTANLFNFMDGADGLAGGTAVVGFGALAAVAALAGVDWVAASAAIIAAAALGFLLLNFPPARVFMGDAGSVTLGFIAASLSVVLVLQHGVSPILPVLVFAPFLFDATVTLLRRLWRGERVWQPHRQHWYQRLVLAGWSHRQVLQLYWALMVAGGTVAIALEWNRAGAPAVLVAGVVALQMLMPGLVWSAERRAGS